MRNILSTLTPAALLLLAVTGGAQAASNAQITITGTVVASTCDVNLSTNNLDLGNFTPTQLTGAGVATPLAASNQQFTVGLSACATPEAGKKASVTVSGQTLPGNSNMFNSTGTTSGVMLSTAATPNTYIANGDTLLIATANATTPTAGDFNGHTLTLNAGLASSTATASVGEVNAPILFNFAYN